jgi:DNA polymerase-3 subunit alpha
MWYIASREVVAGEGIKPDMSLFSNQSIKTDNPGFTHLRVYSSYSLGIGLNTPAEICARAKQLGYSSVAITDTQGTYGFIEFHVAARSYGLKPIYGVIAGHGPIGRPGAERFEVGLLALSRKGLRNLAALASLTAETGVAPGIEMLCVNSADVIAFAGAPGSEIYKLLLQGDEENARKVAGALRDVFGGRFFVEIQDHGVNEERLQANRLLGVASRIQVAPLLTHEVRYMERGMRDFYAMIRGIHHPGENGGFFRNDRQAADWCMKSPVEVSQLRSFYESAYDNTARIDEMIPGDLLVEIDTEEETPAEVTPRGASRDEIIERCVRALRERAGTHSDEEIAHGRAIIEEEVGEALTEGYGPALVLFERVITRLRDAGVELGPATGLGLQSLCAHLLGITAFDPYRYDGGFHPEFDSSARETSEFELQLTGETRAQAAHELVAMFGPGEVGYLPAVERVTPAKAVRMAASIVEASEGELDEIQRIVARHPGVSIGKLHEIDRNVARLYRQSLGVRDLLARAALLEDLPVGFVRSRRSLALSPIPLTDFLGHSIDSETGDLFVQAGRDDFPVGRIHRVDVTSLGALSVAVRTDR